MASAPRVCRSGRQVRVDARGGGRAVPERRLQEPAIDARLQQMGRPGVAQGKDRCVCVEAAGVEGFPERTLHTAPGHRGGGGRPRDPATTRRREDQHGMAMGDPVWAQQGQRVVWPGDIEISPACAMPAVDQPASALEILQLQMGALLQAQTTGVDRGEADSVAQQADTAENRSNRFEAQEHWQFFLARGAHKAAGRPVSGEGVREEARDAAQCNRAGAPRVRLDMLEVQ